MPSLVNRMVDARLLPADWEHKPRSCRVAVVSLPLDHPKSLQILDALDGLNVRRVCRIQNPYLWGYYQLKAEEYRARASAVGGASGCVQEREMYHATAEKNVLSIAHNNFDWRLTKRYMYGKGVSFSPLPLYADRYCSETCGPRRAMIVTSVLVGKASVGFRPSVLPDDGCDTTVSKHGTPKVYVKYADHEFYPAYVAYYTSGGCDPRQNGVVISVTQCAKDRDARDDNEKTPASVGLVRPLENASEKGDDDVSASIRLLRALSNSKFSKKELPGPSQRNEQLSGGGFVDRGDPPRAVRMLPPDTRGLKPGRISSPISGLMAALRLSRERKKQ